MKSFRKWYLTKKVTLRVIAGVVMFFVLYSIIALGLRNQEMIYWGVGLLVCAIWLGVVLAIANGLAFLLEKLVNIYDDWKQRRQWKTKKEGLK